MPDVVSDALNLALEINSVRPACSPVLPMDRLWAPMAKILPFAAAWIGLTDPEGRHYLTASSTGHDAAALEHLESPGFYREAEESGLVRLNRPIRLRGPQTVPIADRSWTEHWWRAGYRNGLAVPLVARDGRNLGLMTLHTDASTEPDDAARDLIGEFSPAISDAVDPLYAVATLRGLVADARAGVVVSRNAEAWPVLDLPPHPALATGSPVIRAALTGLAQQPTGTSFLCPWPGPGSPERLLRVTVIACPAGLSPHLTAIVLVSRPGERHALTRRELEVLGLLIEGCANPQIAAALFITERTAAAHLEHIRAKLNAPTRTVAAIESLRKGLYIPVGLLGDHHLFGG
jgi:DNA-binding CsgD family transcriptional regulator